MSQPVDSVLVPTDGSEGARTGARRGINLAAAIGADPHVLSVVDARDLEADLNSSEQTDRRRLLEEAAEAAVGSVAGLALTHLSGRATTAVESGIPFQTINEYVETHDIDLVVMGTQGRPGLRRYFLGSVTETAVRNAAVPVCCVPMQ